MSEELLEGVFVEVQTVAATAEERTAAGKRCDPWGVPSGRLAGSSIRVDYWVRIGGRSSALGLMTASGCGCCSGKKDSNEQNRSGLLRSSLYLPAHRQ